MPAAPPRVTAPYTLCRHPSTLDRTMLLQSLNGVFAAGWGKAASGRQNARRAKLPTASDPDEDLFHPLGFLFPRLDLRALSPLP